MKGYILTGVIIFLNITAFSWLQVNLYGVYYDLVEFNILTLVLVILTLVIDIFIIYKLYKSNFNNN